MRDTNENWFYLPAGVVAALVLGMVLVPLREHTEAGTFVFAFVILIVVVAVMGGRWAAIATAACSALSLDFFLTRPYLHLAIEDKHDMIAFAGLAICGLVAAAIGSRRGERIAALAAARADLELVHAASEAVAAPGPAGACVSEVLRAAREALPLVGTLVRDPAGSVVATTSPALANRPMPATILDGETLLPAGTSLGAVPHRGLALPAEGGRVSLTIGGRQVGWLDLWGDGRPVALESRRTLAAVARLLATRLQG